MASKPCGSVSRMATLVGMPAALAFVAVAVQLDFNDTVL
jgi:hypothetical protein